MSEKLMMQQLRDTLANLTTSNSTPLEGQLVYIMDTNKIKIGDGIRPFNNLPYQSIDPADISNLLDANNKINTNLLPSANDYLGAANFTGATASNAGSSGFVPAPAAGQENYFLKANGKWAQIAYDGSQSTIVNGIKLADVTNIRIESGVGQVTLKWNDPDDVIYQEAVLAKWAGTKIVRKVGSMPTDLTDGDLVLDSTQKNAHATTGFVDTTVTNNTTYYYRFFPYTTTNTATAGTFTIGTPSEQQRASMTMATDKISTSAGRTRTLTVTTNSDGQVFAASNNPACATVAVSQIVEETDSETGEEETGEETEETPEVYKYLVTITTIAPGDVTITVAQNVGTTLAAPDSIIVPVKIRMYRIMTAKIDTTQSNPALMVSYADDAEGMSIWDEEGEQDSTTKLYPKIQAKMDAWDEFFGHYPVMFKNGLEGKKLNPNDFTKHADGSSADIISGDEGDVMIAFPRRGIKIYYEDDGTTLVVSMTDNPDDDEFTYYAHSRGSVQKNKFYIGAFKGFVNAEDKLCSLSSKTVDITNTILNKYIAARNKGEPDGKGGSGYTLRMYYQIIYHQVMYILKYKHLNSQLIYGSGAGSAVVTGGTYNKGMDFGGDSDTSQVKVFGIEDFWKNGDEFILGLNMQNSIFLVGCPKEDINPNGDTSGKQYYGSLFSDGINKFMEGFKVSGVSPESGYIRFPIGTPESGFLPKWSSNDTYSGVRGASTAYFCDHFTTYYGPLAAIRQSGIFSVNIDFWSNESYAVRLMYL